MEINEFYVMPLGELTVEQYITLIGFIFGLIIVGCAVASIVVDILKIILNLIHYAIRKDKYNSDLIHRRAYKHIAVLRNQFKSARTETEYIIFLNRLSSAFMAYVEVGLIPYEYFDKVFKVSSLYNKAFADKYASHVRARKDRAADENKPTEECSEVDTDK